MINNYIVLCRFVLYFAFCNAILLLDIITKKEYFTVIEKAIDDSLSDFEKKVLNKYINEHINSNDYLEKNLDSSSIILGPSTASNFKRNNIYRFSITIKYRFDQELLKSLKELDDIYATNKKVFLEIDINPLRI
mgnify:CR=1 FL=1